MSNVSGELSITAVCSVSVVHTVTHCSSESSGIRVPAVAGQTTPADTQSGYTARLFTHVLGPALTVTGNEPVNETTAGLTVGARRFRICTTIKSPRLLWGDTDDVMCKDEMTFTCYFETSVHKRNLLKRLMKDFCLQYNIYSMES